MHSYSVEPIATIKSCYTQRFGIPRQAGLVRSAEARIVFKNNTHNLLSLRGLEEFSHIWVIFIFHHHHYSKPKPLVQPPRLGGKKNIGVYATRSPNRANSLGLSGVKLQSVVRDKNSIQLIIRGGDFLDGTPVIDIKPYIPFADTIADATCGWAEPVTDLLAVCWLPCAIEQLRMHTDSKQLDFEKTKLLVEDTVAQDPRPAYERNKDGKPNQQWHMQVYNVDISFQVNDAVANIVNCRSAMEHPHHKA